MYPYGAENKLYNIICRSIVYLEFLYLDTEIVYPNMILIIVLCVLIDTTTK